MELPYHLKTLPPDALDVLRYLGTLEDWRAFKDDICEQVGLTDRGFGKVIRRLVTKGYAVMDGNQVYRLTSQGQESVEELLAYDAVYPLGEQTASSTAERLARRLVLIVPSIVTSGQPTTAYLGFHPSAEFDLNSDVVTRLTVVNGEPDAPQEAVFDLDHSAAQAAFELTPGRYNRLRLRVEVYQLGPNPDDINVAGGMYVDVDVTASDANGGAPLVAYGTDIFIERLE